MDEDRQRALSHLQKAHRELMKARAVLSNDTLWDNAAELVEETETIIRRIQEV